MYIYEDIYIFFSKNEGLIQIRLISQYKHFFAKMTRLSLSCHMWKFLYFLEKPKITLKPFRIDSVDDTNCITDG